MNLLAQSGFLAILQQIIELLVGGITGIATGIGSGLNNLVTNIFIETGVEGAMNLSVFGGVIIIFAGVALAIGLSKWVVNWITSFGN